MASRRSRSRRGRRARRLLPSVRLPALEQHHWDVVGLGLVALAVFFATVFSLGWAGGEVGEGMADGILFLFGGAGYLAPIALFAIGALLVLRPMLPSVRSFRTGGICLAAALTLGLSAGSLGLGPDHAARDGFLDAHYLRHHGGLVGESLFRIVSTLFSTAGAHILFVFLLLAGVLLLTGGSVAGVLQSTRETVAATTRRVKRSTREFAPVTRPLPPDEPPEVEPVVRATHVEMPVLEEEEAEFEPEPEPEPQEPEPEPELLEPDEEPVHEPDPPQAELTPQGNKRSAVTEADDIDYPLPKPRFLKRSSGAQKLDTKGIERRGSQLVEALGHFNVEAKVVGTVTGPHVTRYELRLSPGIKMSKVAQLKDDLAYALAAEHVRILAPIPGKQAVGIEVPNRVRK